jgi:predicted nucleic acid-binding protein
MSRRRVVLDTNVLISAALLAEYREVFSRPKFARIPSAKVAILLALIESEATLVTPTERLAISAHDSDNRFYECADAAGAD